jgi:tRNA (adenine22-N1)-methyltransferase
LALIAGLVPFGSHLADVGTDHGLLPIHLLLDGQIESAVATDLRPGPLSAAMANAAAAGAVHIRFCLCDGLSGVSPDDADTIVIAGMGGENIAQILRNAPWAQRDRLLLLQPMSRPEMLRRALEDMCIRIDEEHIVSDSGRLYPVILARGGLPDRLSPAEYYIGKYDLVSRESLFLPFLTQWEGKIDAALAGLSKSGKEQDISRAEELRTVREGFRRMRCDYEKRI